MNADSVMELVSLMIKARRKGKDIEGYLDSLNVLLLMESSHEKKPVVKQTNDVSYIDDRRKKNESRRAKEPPEFPRRKWFEEDNEMLLAFVAEVSPDGTYAGCSDKDKRMMQLEFKRTERSLFSQFTRLKNKGKVPGHGPAA
jgi:hypothetical protein